MWAPRVAWTMSVWYKTCCSTFSTIWWSFFVHTSVVCVFLSSCSVIVSERAYTLLITNHQKINQFEAECHWSSFYWTQPSFTQHLYQERISGFFSVVDPSHIHAKTFIALSQQVLFYWKLTLKLCILFWISFYTFENVQYAETLMTVWKWYIFCVPWTCS